MSNIQLYAQIIALVKMFNTTLFGIKRSPHSTHSSLLSTWPLSMKNEQNQKLTYKKIIYPPQSSVIYVNLLA